MQFKKSKTFLAAVLAAAKHQLYGRGILRGDGDIIPLYIWKRRSLYPQCAHALF